MDHRMPSAPAPTTEQPTPDLARKVRGLTMLFNTLSHDAPPEEILAFVKDAVESVKELGGNLAKMLIDDSDFRSILSGLSARNNGKTEKLVLNWLKQQLPPPSSTEQS